MAQSPSGDDPKASVPYLDLDGDQHWNGTSIWVEGALTRRGAPTVVTIASGVATITTGYVALAAESSTTDQLDTLTLAGAVAGDEVLLVADTGDTITVDDANINLGAATRAIGPGGHLRVIYDGTEWTELTFLAGSDNV
jgi:hypothetical protein